MQTTAEEIASEWSEHDFVHSQKLRATFLKMTKTTLTQRRASLHYDYGCNCIVYISLT